MNDFKLNIDLIPKGAWGNNLRTLLTKKEWDFLREECLQKANQHCQICGAKTDELDAHEIWEFDIKNKTQTLKDIIGICTKCHGVIHYHNSNRLGYGENAKKHFMQINKTTDLQFASHLAKAMIDYEERNKVYRWKLKVDLDKLGLKDAEIKERNIPFIKNPYKNYDLVQMTSLELQHLFKINKFNKSYYPLPRIIDIRVDNYQGTIIIHSLFTSRIEWYLDEVRIKTKYNVIGKFTTTFKVEGLTGKNLKFKLTGDGGETISKVFELSSQEVL